MFSALIKRPNRKAFWTPKFSGEEKKALEYLAATQDATECSLYHGQRFVKTVKRNTNGMKILGIDPGINCGLAMIRDAYCDFLDHAPVVKEGRRRSINAPRLAEIIEQLIPDVAVMEKVHAMPGQGVTSMFQFGRAVGTLEGVLQTAKLPLHYVSPQTWKKHFKLGADKEACRARAIQLYPFAAACLARRKDADRAEALLIARWFADTRK